MAKPHLLQPPLKAVQRATDRIAGLLACATMPDIVIEKGTPSWYISPWREMWGRELTRRAVKIRMAMDDLLEHT